MKLFQSKDRLLLALAIVLGGINAALSAFISILLQHIIDAATTRNIPLFSRMFFYMLAYLAILGTLGFLEAFCGKLLIRNVSLHLRERLFHGILRRAPARFQSQNSADYLSALLNDVKLLEEHYLIPLLLCTQMTVLFLTTLGILFYLSPLVTAVLLFFLAVMFLIPALLGKNMQKKQDAYSEQLARYTACTKDYLNGFEVIFHYDLFGHIFKKHRRINKETARKKFRSDALLAVNETLSDVLSSLSVAVIIFVSAYLLLKGRITMGTLLALVQLSGTFVTPVVILMQNLPKISGMKPILNRLEALQEDSSDEAPTSALTELPPFQSLQCKNVSFQYEDGKPVLSNLNLSLHSGRKYALLGDSGCGKSTLIRLLTGYRQDYSGEILYNRQSIQDLSLPQLSRFAAVIHQNVFLFDTDIYENICLGRDYPKEELNAALINSGVAQFLPFLEQGLHTPVGENGQNLSGGQRQRIAVARALIRRTPLLIIDEGTSAVDQRTAHEIEEHLLTQPGLTILAVTHHMDSSLEPLYDQIFHMEQGAL